MAAQSSIEWTDATWNPIVGCSIVSPGCTNCYAMKMAARIIAMAGTKDIGVHYDRTIKDVKGQPVWTGHVAQAPNHILLAPLKWRKPKRIFVNSMGDLFHESIPDEWIDRVFAVIACAGNHTFQVLTKRAARMRDYMTNLTRERIQIQAYALSRCVQFEGRWLFDLPLPNVWLGVSAERQQEADERIPLLLQTPAAVRFVSAEPLLGPIRLDQIAMPSTLGGNEPSLCQLDWVIVGGESGSRARPMHPDFALSLRDQCAAAGVPFFFKQFGEFASGYRDRMGAGKMVFRRFTSFGQWVDKASTWVNGGICLDKNGAELRNGAAFAAARDENRFPVTIMHRIGKKAAGRLLDGVEHSAFPVSS